MKKKILILVIIICLIVLIGIGIYYYLQNANQKGNNNTEDITSNNLQENISVNNINTNETSNNIVSSGNIEVGTTESRGFILDNVFHSEEQGDIHFSSYYPNGYEEKGLSNEEIDKILILDVKDHDYFTTRGFTDEHMGCSSFTYEEDIMNWVFSKTK